MLRAGIITAMAAVRGSEKAAKAWLLSRRLKPFLTDANLQTLFRRFAGNTGKVVDWIAENPTTRSWVLVEAKDILNVKELKRSFKGISKFENTINTMRELYRQTGKTMPAIEELVITAKSINIPPGKWAVLADGTLVFDGVPQVIDGIRVVVREIPEFF